MFIIPSTKSHIELYVRSLLPNGAHERQETVITQLEELTRRDKLADFSVIVWGKRIARDSAAAHTEEGRYILNRVAEFKQWALSNNVSLDSFSRTNRVENEATDESLTAMTLPVMGLAEYTDGELTHVAPCTNGAAIHTIGDRLERLEHGEPSALEQARRNPSPV